MRLRLGYRIELKYLKDHKILVKIFHWNIARRQEEQAGEYTRNHPCFFNTFHPFKHKEKDYALYSSSLHDIHIMSLPDCKDIDGFEEYSLCARDFLVPSIDRYKQGFNGVGPAFKEVFAKWGLVSGPEKEGDINYNICYLDLSTLSKEVFSVNNIFGYTQIPDNRPLVKSVDLSNYWKSDPLEDKKLKGARKLRILTCEDFHMG